jgi:AcrR family transcriptional regulator
MIHSSTRRDRLRADMFTRIKGNARLLLTAGGARAVSLRAIAREIGVTPAAIYRYYPNLQALIDALHEDILGELVTRIQAVRDQYPEDCATIRIGEMARAFRWWALEHPAEFWLALGPDPAGPAEVAGASGLPVIQFPRLIAVFADEFARLWQHAAAQPSAGGPARELTRVHVGTVPPARPLDVPLAAILRSASAWAKLYGLVAMEVSGQVPWPRAVTDALFEAEIAELGHLPPGTAGRPAAGRCVD